MISDDYEVLIQSDNPEVREINTKTGTLWIGVPNATYTIKIKNNNPDYRIFTSACIDGVEVMEGWGLLVKPLKSVVWDGYRIDDDHVHEFKFVEDPNESVAFQQGKKTRIGYIEIEITKEYEKWDILNAPPPMIMSMLSTGLGDLKQSSVRQTKIPFKWGGDKVNLEIRYGTEQELRAAGLLE